MRRLLGVDIGGTKCAVCLGTADARIQGRREFPTSGSPAEVLGRLACCAHELLQEGGPADAIGIVCGGPLDAARGVVLSPPNLPGWDRIAVVEFFSGRFGVPVLLKNDANAGALAEWRHGAGKGSRNMMFCTMGTGFGCGLILDGRLYEGTNGNAGELGHVRLSPRGPVGYGKAGSVEGWCSGGGIARMAGMRLGALRAAGAAPALSGCADLTARALADAAAGGDQAALRIFREVGERLGMALSFSVDLLNLELIVLGGIFARSEKLIRPSMERVMRRESLPGALAVCGVRAAALGESIGDVAALSAALLAMEET